MATAYFLNQYITTNLNVGGGIDASQTTGIILLSVTGIDITKPGIACLSYTEPLNTANAEWITYTSIDGSNELQGVTRGAEGFSAKTHANQVAIAFPLSESHINQLATALSIGGVATNAVTQTVNTTAQSTAPTTELVTKNYVDTPTKSIVLPAGSMSPTTTAGCASVATVEAGTNDVDYKVLDFDTATDESAFIVFAMPDSWNGSTITFIPYWTAASGSGTVCFALSGRAFANDDAIDQAYGTPQTSTDTLITAGDVHIGPASAAITLAGTLAGGQLVQLKITRDVSEDTLGVDARLMAIKIEYGVNAHSD